VVLIGFFFGDIKIDIGNGSVSVTHQHIDTQLSNIQPISWLVFRSPGESFQKELSAFQNTKKTLDLRTYEFTHKEFKTTLKNLAENDVKIRIIVEDQKYKQYQNTLRELVRYFSWYQNIQLKSDKQMGTEYVHAKVNLIDSGFIIQTANLTHSAFTKNREHFFQSYDTGVQESLKNIFEKDRNGEKITMKDIHPNLVICNINCRGVIEYLLDWAKESIIIQTQYITDPSVWSILRDKKTLPEFKIIVSDTDTTKDMLHIFGNNYARALKKYYNHTKMIVVDHKILLLGSMNLSANSLDNNREIWIVLNDPIIIDEFIQQFYSDWETNK